MELALEALPRSARSRVLWWIEETKFVGAWLIVSTERVGSHRQGNIRTIFYLSMAVVGNFIITLGAISKLDEIFGRSNSSFIIIIEKMINLSFEKLSKKHFIKWSIIYRHV